STDALVNIYYDPDLLVNFYLHGQTYDLAGAGGGQLIPDPYIPTPVPPSLLLLGSGLLGLGLLGWRRKRSR
ncbi:MAG: PEP-CTERM sorting domain-containing protein, partial [Syntrophobacterales bacterium]